MLGFPETILSPLPHLSAPVGVIGSYGDDFFDSAVFSNYKSQVSTPFSSEDSSPEIFGEQLIRWIICSTLLIGLLLCRMMELTSINEFLHLIIPHARPLQSS
jgi:hypothetical protein